MATSVELVVADNAELQRYEARRGSDVVGFVGIGSDRSR